MRVTAPLHCAVGVDGCRGGWLAVGYDPEGRRIEWRVHSAFKDLLIRYPDAACIAVDISIGLTEDGRPRECDLQARRALAPKRSSSVFPAPDRRLLNASTYSEARALSRRLLGKGVSKQPFAIFPKIAEVDNLMTPALQQRVIEVHPEVCFWALGQRQAMVHRKATREGYEERRKLLAVVFENVPIPTFEEARLMSSRVRPDDVLDALAAAWTKYRFAQGCSERLPATPPLDPKGLRMEMVF